MIWTKAKVIGSSEHDLTFITGIYGVTASRCVAVFIELSGHLGTSTSSARFKEQVKPMNKASEAIHALQPVTFRYKHELDPDGIPQFDLVADLLHKSISDSKMTLFPRR